MIIRNKHLLFENKFHEKDIVFIYYHPAFIFL